jgi:hypothetical protein
MRAVSDRRRKRDAVYPARREQVWGAWRWDVRVLPLRRVSRRTIWLAVVGLTRTGWTNLIGLCAAECHERAHGSRSGRMRWGCCGPVMAN